MQNTVLLQMCSKFCLIDKKLASFVVLKPEDCTTLNRKQYRFVFCKFRSNWNPDEFESSAKQTFFFTQQQQQQQHRQHQWYKKKKRQSFCIIFGRIRHWVKCLWSLFAVYLSYVWCFSYRVFSLCFVILFESITFAYIEFDWWSHLAYYKLLFVRVEVRACVCAGLQMFHH